MLQPLGPKGGCPLGVEKCPVFSEIQHLHGECKRLARQLETDPLTGLYNLRHLLSTLEREMERSRRTGLPTGLIMIDLDHFKQINDTYGHQAGNKVLQWVSQIWRQNVRRIDIACRYGGEEFAIILPATRLTHAVRTAERLRALVANSPLELNNEEVSLTASFGVDTYVSREKLSVDAFIRRTDQFLLEAKANGRNRVCHAETGKVKAPIEITPEERAMLFVGRWPKED
jgi:two-component system, cell cycle response regulator